MTSFRAQKGEAVVVVHPCSWEQVGRSYNGILKLEMHWRLAGVIKCHMWLVVMEIGPAHSRGRKLPLDTVRHNERMSTLPSLPGASLQFLKISWVVILSASSGSGCKCFSTMQNLLWFCINTSGWKKPLWLGGLRQPVSSGLLQLQRRCYYKQNNVCCAIFPGVIYQTSSGSLHWKYFGAIPGLLKVISIWSD